jgi:hypothetical protein
MFTHLPMVGTSCRMYGVFMSLFQKSHQKTMNHNLTNRIQSNLYIKSTHGNLIMLPSLRAVVQLHIGTPYRGKHFWTHQIPTSCLPKSGGIISEH